MKGRKTFFFEPYRRPDSDCAALPLRHRDAVNQKTFAPLRAGVIAAAPRRINKVFFASFLFTKKKSLPSVQVLS
jgi:hypothetical protein